LNFATVMRELFSGSDGSGRAEAARGARGLAAKPDNP
jgi:hypothetical protein